MPLDWIFIERLVKFGIVGSISFVIDFGLTYFGKEKLKLNKFIANTIGFIFSVGVNFMLNKYWTFQSMDTNFGVQFAKFITIASFALIINSIIIYLLNVKIRMNFYFSKLIAVFIVMFFNYSMNTLYTFTSAAK
jgi:putative flippase GtrA